MTQGPAVPAWETPGWRDGMAAWLNDSLAAADIDVTGEPVEHQRRPWSVVFSIETSHGRLFFKAVLDRLKHEVGLHRALFSRHPDAVPSLVAVDPSSGWLLMEDAGQPLRQSITGQSYLDRFSPALVRMAELQIAWLDRIEELHHPGVLDRRPESLSGALAGLMDDPQALATGLAGGITQDEHKRLRDLLPTVDELCQRLAAWGPPSTLHHDDFHDANIYVKSGKHVFADWGEAGVGHPFFTPMIALRVLAWRLKLPPDSPQMEGLRRAYLEVWQAHASPSELRRAFDLAQRLAPISRALTWHAVMSAVPMGSRGEDAAAAAGWLRTALARLESHA